MSTTSAAKTRKMAKDPHSIAQPDHDILALDIEIQQAKKTAAAAASKAAASIEKLVAKRDLLSVDDPLDAPAQGTASSSSEQEPNDPVSTMQLSVTHQLASHRAELARISSLLSDLTASRDPLQGPHERTQRPLERRLAPPLSMPPSMFPGDVDNDYEVLSNDDRPSYEQQSSSSSRIAKHADRLHQAQRSTYVSLDDDPKNGESDEESVTEVEGSDNEEGQRGNGSLHTHSYRHIVLEKQLNSDNEQRELSETFFSHNNCKQDAMAALKRKAALARTIAVMWRSLQGLQNSYGSTLSPVAIDRASAGTRFHRHPDYRALLSELTFLRGQYSKAAGDVVAYTIVDVCADPAAAFKHIQQQWMITGNKPDDYMKIIISVQKSSAFAKFLVKDKARSNPATRRAQWRREDSDDDSKPANKPPHRNGKGRRGNAKGKGKGQDGGGAASRS